MTKYLVIMMMMALMIFTMGACKKDSNETMDHSNMNMESTETMDHGSMDMDHSSGDTKMVKVDKYMVAFDFTTKMEHMKMMKDMGDSMDGMKMEDAHYIALTISDDAAKKVVKGAKVFIEIEGPNDSSQKKMAMVMEGKGMYHYSAGCDLTAKGMYNVKARFIIDGASLEAKVMYTTD